MQYNTLEYTNEKNISENKINQRRRNVLKFQNIFKIRNYNKRNDDLFYELNSKTNNSLKKINKLNYNIKNINITYNNYGSNNNLDNNENLIYNQTSPNEVSMINNYNEINRNKFKKILFKNIDNNSTNLYRNIPQI